MAARIQSGAAGRRSIGAGDPANSPAAVGASLRASVTCNLQEPEAAKRSSRPAKPFTNLQVPCREARREDGCAPSYSRPLAAGLLENQDNSHYSGSPPQIPSRRLRNYPCFRVERAAGCLEIREAALRLDNQKRPLLRVPRQDVHRSTVTVVVERVLDHRLPTLGTEARHHAIDHGRMPFIDQLVEFSPSSAGRKREVHPDGGCYGPNGVDAERRDVPPLQQRDALSSDSHRLGDVDLASPAALAAEADCRAKPQIVLDHRRSKRS